MKNGRLKQIILILVIAAAVIFVIYNLLPRCILKPKYKQESDMMVKFIRQSNAPGKAVQDIERKLSQEEIEYNRAKVVEELKKKKYDVLAFEYSLSTAEKPAAAAWAKFEKEFSRWQENKTDVGGFFKIVDSAKQELEKTKSDIRFIRVPSGISEEIDSLLAEAKTDLQSAYNKKNEALNYIIKFIDENKPSYFYKFNEDLKYARELTSEAVLNIIEAKKKIGLQFFPEYETNSPINTSRIEPCNCVIQGISLVSDNKIVFTSKGTYHIGDKICDGSISKILPDKITISFPDADREYRVGDTVNR